MADGLTKLQKRFIEEYLRTGNARQSAITAGYSEQTADNATLDILGSISVRQEIDRRQEMIRKAYVDKLVKGGEKAIKALLEVAENGKHGARVAAAREILDRIGVIRTERRELTGKDGGPIEHEDLSGMTNEQLLERLRIIRGNSGDRADDPTE